MNKMQATAVTLASMVLIAAVFVLGYIVGIDSEQARAVKQGAAHYSGDPDTGKPVFTYGPK